MAQKEFKKANFAKLFNYNVFFGNYLQYISWSVKNSKTVDTLVEAQANACAQFLTEIKSPCIFKTDKVLSK